MNLPDTFLFNHELRRFFSRVLAEALHLRADRVVYRRDGQDGVQIVRSGRPLKEIQIAAEWWPRVTWWFSQLAPAKFEKDRFQIRFKGDVLGAKLAHDENGFSLDELGAQSLPAALISLGFDDAGAASISNALERPNGLLVLVEGADFPAGLRERLAAISGAGIAVSLSKENVGSALQHAVTEGIVCGTAAGAKVANALKTLVANGVALEKMGLLGFVSYENGKPNWRSPLGDRVQSGNISNPVPSSQPAKSALITPLILVVEDDPDQQDILSMMLRADGFEVMCASNGKQALEAVAKKRPALVLTDLMMPVMDGRELVQKLKADTVLKTIPVMILTAIDDEGRELELLNLGVVDYCVKATQPKILLQKIRNLLGAQRVAG